MATALTRIIQKYSDSPLDTIKTDVVPGGSQALGPGELMVGYETGETAIVFVSKTGQAVSLEPFTALEAGDIPDLSAAYATAAQGALADSALQSGDNNSVLTNDAKYIPSDTTTAAGSDQITNIVSLTEAEYLALTPNASTLYVIV